MWMKGHVLWIEKELNVIRGYSMKRENLLRMMNNNDEGGIATVFQRGDFASMGK
jgi:hypothetical protein